MSDLDFLHNVETWPKCSDGTGYVCLVRQLKESRQHGFMLAGSWDVNLGYIFDGGTGDFIPYSKPEDAINAGWTVD